MSNALAVGPANDRAEPPFNLEAEQALLGAVLYDNAAFEPVDHLKPEDFYEPLHSRIWQVILQKAGKDLAVEPIMLDEALRGDPAYLEIGGVRYLADLVDRCGPPSGAKGFGELIRDLAIRRELLRIAGEAAQEVVHDRTRTAREHVEEVEQRLFALAETGSSQGFRSFSDYLTGAINMAAEAYQRDGGLAGLSTGLIDIDRKLGGLHKSDLIIIAARPAMGKTALATNIAFNVAKKYQWSQGDDGRRVTQAGGSVAFFSLEMSGEQLATRILADAAGVSSDKIRRGLIEKHEFGHIRDAAELINSIPLHIDVSAGLNIAKLMARARRLHRTVGLDLVVVDYLQLATAPSRRNDGRVQEISEITQGLKAMAKELNVPVIALSQLSRAVESREDKRPQLADLRESGSIEQDADVVAFIYREEYYLEKAEPKAGSVEHQKWQDEMNACRGVADLIIAKQRHGPIGTVRLAYKGEHTKFSDLAREGRDYGAVRLPYRDDA